MNQDVKAEVDMGWPTVGSERLKTVHGASLTLEAEAKGSGLKDYIHLAPSCEDPSCTIVLTPCP